MMSDDRPQFSLVIPAYNEVGRIESTLRDLFFTLDYQFRFNTELLIIMDGCKDGTPEIVKSLIGNRFGVTAITVPNRLGKGGAIIEALKHVNGDLIAFIDADGSIAPSELNKLFRFTEDYDLVIGSRYVENSMLPVRRPLVRFFYSRCFNVISKIMFWRLHDIKDTQCGVKVFTKKMVDKINRDFLVTDFAFDVNLIYSAMCHGFNVKEVGITWVEKDGGKLTHGTKSQTLIMAFSLLRLRIYYSALRGLLGSKIFTKIDNFLCARFKS